MAAASPADVIGAGALSFVGVVPSSNTAPSLTELEELQAFRATAATPGVQGILDREISSRQARLAALEAPPAPPSSTPASSAPSTVSARGAPAARQVHHLPPLPSQSVTFKKMKWGWESGTKFVNVYCTVPGLAKSDKAKVEVDFSNNSFDLRVSGVGGDSFRLVKTNLDKDIDPEGSKVRVKDGKVVVNLRKLNEYDYWTDLTSSRPRTTAGPAAPDGGIMNVLGDMYNSGDDKMKRVIGEAWSKSQQQRAMGGGSALPMPGADMDFGL